MRSDVGQQLRKEALALAKLRPAQVEPLDVEQVERIIEQPVLPAGGEIGVEQSKIGDAPRIRDDGLAIQDQVLCRKGRERVGNRLKAQRPVVARAGVDGRPSVSQVRLRAVPVKLDLMQPAPARRSLVAQHRMTGLDESRERRRLRAGQPYQDVTLRRAVHRCLGHGTTRTRTSMCS
jgi:hypothetical protein